MFTEQGQTQVGLTSRAVVLSVVFVVIGNYWIRVTGLVNHAVQIGESVPPIPAVAVLIFMTALNPLLRRCARVLSFSQPEIIVVYCTVGIAVSMSSVGMLRYFLPVLTAPFYYATPENEYALFNQYLPSWLVVSDKSAILQSYEGGDSNGSVPWGAWLTPLLAWTLMFVALFWTMLCLVVLFRRRWMDEERLVFPVAKFGLEIARPASNGSLVAPFFKNRYMWVGFGLAFVYNLCNIIHAFIPGFPALGKSFDFGALFTESPWSALSPFAFQLRPAIFGLAYLMPLDVNFSVWFFYLVIKLEAVGISAMGYNLPGVPYVHDQSSGAFLAISIALIWVSRKSVGNAIGKALGRQELDDSCEPLSYRIAFFGAICGVAFLCVWCVAAGMSIGTVLVYFGLIFAFALVYTKIRAQAGAPMIWLFPYGEHKRLMLNALGSGAFIQRGSFQNLSVFASLTFLSRGYFPSFMAYQLESMKRGEAVDMRHRRMALVIMLGLGLGLSVGYWMNLDTFYRYGANSLDGGDGIRGGTRGASLILQEYEMLRRYLIAPDPPDVVRTTAVGIGFAFTTALSILRRCFLQFPFHPLGFAMVTAYGDPLWGAFLSAWVFKVLITRFGGIGLYRKLIPGFLGIALGHFFTAGIVWGVLATMGDEVSRAYGVWFG